MHVGVLALQGDFKEHTESLIALGIKTSHVRISSELNQVDALIIPGGESTTIAKLARSFNLFQPLQERISSGMPIYGSCAGMILLANQIIDGAYDQETLGGLDIVVRRNAFGRQIDSFEADIDFKSVGKVRAVFIRAPWVESYGTDVEVLASYDGHAVAIRQKNVLATSFHPELVEDQSVHHYFIDQICRPALAKG